MAVTTLHTLGIDIGSTTVKVAVLSPTQELLFSDYRRHYANIQETLAALSVKRVKNSAICRSPRSSRAPAV